MVLMCKADVTNTELDAHNDPACSENPITWKRAKQTPSVLMCRPPSGNPRKPGWVMSATPAKHKIMAMPTALQRHSHTVTVCRWPIARFIAMT